MLKPARRDQCIGCHRAPLDNLHRDLTSTCGHCHTQAAWTPATFDHDRLFRLDGDHQASCKTCHTGQDYRTYTCYGCHEHSRADIREKQLEEGIADFENCVECHRSGDEEAGEDHDEGHDRD